MTGRRWRGVDAESLALAASALRAGAVVAVPTDTVYGIVARARDPLAVERLYQIKHREECLLPDAKKRMSLIILYR